MSEYNIDNGETATVDKIQLTPSSGVGTGGSGGSMNRAPELLGPPSRATENF